MEKESTLAFICSSPSDGGGQVVSCSLDRERGALRRVSTTPAAGASFAAVHPDGTHLYTANRVSGGTVTAYRIDAGTGDLTELNRQSSGGGDPCYVDVDGTGSYVFVANFSGGTVSVLPIAGGTLGPATVTVSHRDSLPDASKNRDPHPHAVCEGPDGDFVYVPDRGLDRIAVYRFDRDEGRLRPADPQSVPVGDGAGPRHVAFHPNGRFAYVINELDSTLTAFERDPETGWLDEVDTVSTLPEGYGGDNDAADVHVHPSGRWVYGSNRGHDSVAVFRIDAGSGRLRPVEFEPTRGRWPRDFAVDPAGRYLLAANQRSDTVSTFAVGDSCRLTPTGHQFDVPAPVCLRFVDPA